MEVEGRIVVTGLGEGREMGKCWTKGTKLQLHKMKMAGDLMFILLYTVSDTILNTGNLLRVDFRCSYHPPQKKVTLRKRC